MMKSVQIGGSIFEVRRFTVHDGPGIRTTVFLQGCPLRCLWCHNPEGIAGAICNVEHRTSNIQRAASNIEHRTSNTEHRTGNGTDHIPDPGAERSRGSGGLRGWVTADEVVREIARDAAYYDASGGGATFSGGEPLMQPEFLGALLRGCRARGIRAVVDTSGQAEPGTLELVADDVALFLYDLKLMDDEAHRRHTGQSNAPALRNLEWLARRGSPVWIRVPLVPGVTLDAANLDAMIAFLRPWPALRRVCLLPFHGAAAGKYARLGRADPMAGVAPPPEQDVVAARRRFESAGFEATVGG